MYVNITYFLHSVALDVARAQSLTSGIWSCIPVMTEPDHKYMSGMHHKKYGV